MAPSALDRAVAVGFAALSVLCPERPLAEIADAREFFEQLPALLGEIVVSLRCHARLRLFPRTGNRHRSETMEFLNRAKSGRAPIARELVAQKSLFEKGLTQLSRLLALERAAKNLEGQSGAVGARIARARGGIAELEVEILQIDARRIEEAEQQARDVSAKENQVKERLASVRGRLGRMEVRAPVAGEVFGMTVFAPREVVRPGEPILRIVPADASLVAVARLNPIDVDQVYPGQPALLRFSAFPARETPEFEGRVVRVSADAVRDERAGVSWYEVELAMEEPSGAGERRGGGAKPVSRRFDGLEIAPGMPVEAHIRTGERTVIGYLVKPVTDFFQRALREE